MTDYNDVGWAYNVLLRVPKNNISIEISLEIHIYFLI